MTPSNAAPVRTVRWKGASTDGVPQRKYWRVGLILGLILAAVVLVSVIVALLLAPLFTWKTAFVSLVIDQYRIGSLAAVPFAIEDKTALAASLAHSLPTDQTTDSVHLVGFETSAAIRERLGNRLLNLPLRSKDVLVAYVRAQSMVAPPSLDADGIERTDPLNNKVCLIASDFRIEGERPRGLVPMRELVESIGRESSSTTLIAIDFGDLRWDPRAGVIAGLVPKMLDDEFAEPQRKATGANWVVGSHDLFEYSGTYLPERRTYFARSLELGLSGAADAAPWGDGDLLVELDELLRFVSAWTSQWARQSSGGRSLQNPVVWKLGVGRVPLSSVPPNIAVVRVPVAKKKNAAQDKAVSDKPNQEKQEKTAPEKKAEPSSPAATQPAPVPQQKSPAGPVQNSLPKTSAAVPAASARQPALFQPESKAARLDARKFSAGVVLTAAEKDAAKPDAGPAFPAAAQPPAADAATPTAAPSTASPPAEGPPPPAAAAPAPAAVPKKPPAAIPPPPLEPEVLPPNLWLLIEQQNSRRKQAPASGLRPALVDFAPHLWAELVALAGSAQLQALQNDSGSLRTNAFLDQFTADLANLSAHSNTAEAVGIRSSPIVSLQQTLEKAESKHFFEAWENAPPRFRNALAVRNDAVVSLLAIVNLNAIFAGGSGTPKIEPATLLTAISQTARLSSIINGFPSISSPDEEPLRLDPLDDASRSVSLLLARLNKLVDLLFVNLLDSGAINQSTVSYTECSAALRLPFLSMPQRDALVTMIRPNAEATLSGDQSPGPADEMPFDGPSMLLAIGRVPLPPETPIRIQRIDLANIAVLVDCLAAIVDAAGILSDSTSHAPPEIAKTVRDISDVRRACESLASFASDEKVAVGKILQLAAKLSQLYSKAASEVDSTTISSGGFRETDRGAALLRILDPRDAENLPTVEIASIPRWGVVNAVGMVLQPIDGIDLEFQKPALIRLAFGDRDKKQVPVNATLRLRYDPADMQVRASGGGILDPNRGNVLSDLPLRTEGLRLELLANRKATESDLDGQVRLRAILELGGRTEEAELYVNLPSERTVTLSVRRTPVANAATRNGWIRSRVSTDSIASDALVKSTVQLPCLPSRITAWELGLENKASIPRTVSVEIYSVPSSQQPGAREKNWKEAAAQILDGTSTLAKMAVIAKVELPVSQSMISLPLPPEAVLPAILPLPAPAGTPPAPATPAPAPAPIPIGPDLALLVREITVGQQPRAWLTRLFFEVEHPRTLLVPTAIWNSRERTITVEVSPSDAAGKGEGLPPDGVRVSMKPLSVFPVIGRQPIELRKSEALLTPSRPADVLMAVWNGSDRSGRAWLAIDIDGYPRAMVMAVDCSQATDGERQGAQYDWRNISFLNPLAKETVVKAPAATVGFHVAADAPPDSFRMKNGVDTSTVSLSLREDRGDASAPREGRVVWSATADRQVEFVRGKAVVPGTLAVMTTVQDWKINASGEGFENIDILAQARLSIPGVQQPLADQRLMVFDARAPVVEAPPSMNVSVGKPLVIPVRVMDDPRESFAAAATKHLPGVSGVDRVEWGIDTKGNGVPETWQPAVSLGGGVYELRVVTTTLPPGKQTLLLVRAFDRAGLSDPPDRVWLTAAAVVARNCIEGRVILNGKGEAGVLVTADGPSAPKPIKTDKEGKFKFSDVDAGDYKLQATGPIRNQSYRSEIVPVVVSPPPAPPASALLPLK